MVGTDNSTAFTDSSKDNRSIQAAGNIKIVTSEPMVSGSSAYCDGNGDYLTSSDLAAAIHGSPLTDREKRREENTFRSTGHHGVKFQRSGRT